MMGRNILADNEGYSVKIRKQHTDGEEETPEETDECENGEMEK